MIQIEKPPPPALVQALAGVVGEAKLFEVLDEISHGIALENIKKLRNGERAITEYYEPSRKALDAAKREVLAARDGLIAPFAEARGIYDRKALTYENEAKAKADQLQRELEEKARRAEQERQFQEALAAENAGDIAGAQAIMKEEPLTPVLTVRPEVAAVTGVSKRTQWDPHVTDVRACLAFLLARPEWLPLLDKCIPILESGLRPLAASQHEAMKVPGVEVHAREIRSSGR